MIYPKELFLHEADPAAIAKISKACEKLNPPTWMDDSTRKMYNMLRKYGLARSHAAMFSIYSMIIVNRMPPSENETRDAVKAAFHVKRVPSYAALLVLVNKLDIPAGLVPLLDSIKRAKFLYEKI